MQASESTYERFERMWASDSLYVRRMLIGLTRDIDLADDLLQETYLRAREGISGYRGDNDRAWLSTIAKNLFLAHVRRRYVHAETPIDGAEYLCGLSSVGTPDHLAIIRIREAISELATDLRTALLMKHYCGYTYDEIADRTHCAVGTAKWRVSVAVGKLKEAIGVTEDAMEMTCADLTAVRMLDYLYGSLMPDELGAMDRHLGHCPKCRSRLDGTSRITSALDALESDAKLMHIVELDAEGKPAVYATWRSVNTHDRIRDEVEFRATKSYNLEYLGAQGEELALICEDNDDPNYPDTYNYRADLPRPVAPGETWDTISIYRPSDVHAAVKQEDGWMFRWSQLTSVERESAYVLAIRLPTGARLLTADPSADEVRARTATTTLVWRRLLAANQGLGCTIKYQLDHNTL